MKTECDLDRATENIMVLEYQETLNEELFSIILENRMPTLNYWTHLKYNNNMTIDTPEDFVEDCKIVLLKAIKTYKEDKKIDFNTWLYTLLLNRLKNLYQKSSCKKRTSNSYIGSRSTTNISLQSPVEGTDGTIGTLQDKLATKTICGESDHVQALSGDRRVQDIARLIETDIQDNYKGAPRISEIIIGLVNGYTAEDISRKYNYKVHNIYSILRGIKAKKYKYIKYFQN